jgi:hypothetical protein
VSFGAERCADSATPGVYSRVSALSAWISRTAGLASAPPAPAPPAGTKPPVARFGRITCGAVRCRIEIRFTNDSSLGSVLVRARRGSVSRAARARRVSAGRWVASLNLPYGVVRLSAAPLARNGSHIGRPAGLTIQVS